MVRYQADLDRGLKKGMLSNQARERCHEFENCALDRRRQLQHKILGLKLKAQRQLSHLGARVYSLMAFRGKNTGLDASMKDITARLRRYETEIDMRERQLCAIQKKMEKRA